MLEEGQAHGESGGMVLGADREVEAGVLAALLRTYARHAVTIQREAEIVNGEVGAPILEPQRVRRGDSVRLALSLLASGK